MSKKEAGSTAQQQSLSDYGSSAYWEARYKALGGDDQPMTFDWYQDYETLKPSLQPFLQDNKDLSILIPGCGNSRLGPDLYKDGYKDITSIDISPLVVERMTDLFHDLEDLEYRQMDARDMKPLPDKSFDLVIDKGLFDSQLCSKGNVTNVGLLVREIYRVLKPGGIYLVISYGFPATRMGYLTSKKLDWTVEHQTIPKPKVPALPTETGDSSVHYIYICKKKTE